MTRHLRCRDCRQKLHGAGMEDGFCWYCDDDRKYGVGDQRCGKCEGPWRQGRCINNCGTQPGDDSLLSQPFKSHIDAESRGREIASRGVETYNEWRGPISSVHEFLSVYCNHHVKGYSYEQGNCVEQR
jgi:hypothetical protein